MLKRYAKAPHHTMLIEMSLNHLARYLLLSVLTLLWQPAIAAIDGSHLVDRGLSDISTSPLVYFEDAEASYTPQRAWQRLNALRDVKQATLPFDQGLADTRYWLALTLENHSAIEQIMHLVTGIAYAPTLRGYLFYDDDSASMILDDRPSSTFTERALPYRHLSSSLFTLPAEGNATLLLEYHPIGSSYLPLQLVSPVDSLMIQQASSLEAALFYAFSVSTLLFLLLFGIVMSEMVVIRYCGLFTMGLLMIAAMEGIAFQMVWPGHAEWNHYSPIVLLYLTSAAGFHVARKTLGERAPTTARRLLLLFMATCVLLAAVTPFTSFVTLANMSNLALVTMFAANVFAISTWATQDHATRRFRLGIHVVITIAVVLLIALSISHAMVPSTLYIHSARTVYLIMLLTTVVTLAMHIRSSHRGRLIDLRTSLAEALSSSSESPKATMDTHESAAGDR